MDRGHYHPLIASGSMLSAMGAVVREYVPTLFGFALTLLGLWLQRLEHQRHERALTAIRRPPFLPSEAVADSPE